MKRSELKELLEEAVLEVLAEQELKTASQEILGKFPTLKRQLIALLTAEYEEFVDEVKWVAPKPSTFQVVLNNGEKFFLKWDGEGFEAQIGGKKYSLVLVHEFQQALDKLNELLKHGPVKSTSDIEAEMEPETGGDAFGGGGSEPAFGGEETPETEEIPEEEPEVEFEEPGEEPEV